MQAVFHIDLPDLLLWVWCPVGLALPLSGGGTGGVAASVDAVLLTGVNTLVLSLVSAGKSSLVCLFISMIAPWYNHR